MKLVLFGAGGNIGRRIAREALDRGHQVTAVVRDPARAADLDPRLSVAQGDATDAAAIERIARGADAILSAVGNTTSMTGPAPSPLFASVARALIAGAKKAGVRRILVLGGAGSLEVAPRRQAVDAPVFPEAYKGDALGQREALYVWRAGEAQGLDWTYISPAGEIGPGARTGRYRVGGDELLVDATGASRISYDDYAVAFLDTLERGDHLGRRISVAY